MRDTGRIEFVLDALRKAWLQAPDLRLGQLLVAAGEIANGDTATIFYREDVDWQEQLLTFAAIRLRKGGL